MQQLLKLIMSLNYRETIIRFIVLAKKKAILVNEASGWSVAARTAVNEIFLDVMNRIRNRTTTPLLGKKRRFGSVLKHLHLKNYCNCFVAFV